MTVSYLPTSQKSKEDDILKAEMFENYWLSILAFTGALISCCIYEYNY